MATLDRFTTLSSRVCACFSIIAPGASAYVISFTGPEPGRVYCSENCAAAAVSDCIDRIGGGPGGCPAPALELAIAAFDRGACVVCGADTDPDQCPNVPASALCGPCLASVMATL